MNGSLKFGSFFDYSGLNFQDLMTRLGVIDSCPKPPFILGSECAGEVEQVGENVENFKVSKMLICKKKKKNESL